MEPPDRLKKGVRFGCGFLFGCFVGVGALLTSLWSARYIVASIVGCFVGVGALLTSLWSAHYIVASIVALGLLCGYAAMKFGDRFWDHALRWWWTLS